MYMHMVKISAIVIGVVVLAYFFIPGNAKPGKTQAKSAQATPVASHQAKSGNTTVSRSSQTKTHKNKVAKKYQKEARIEPDMSLRKETQVRRRSGPPSKMYGGL